MTETLLQPADCLFLFVDYQAGLAFGVESIARQAILNNAVSLARTAMVFNAPICGIDLRIQGLQWPATAVATGGNAVGAAYRTPEHERLGRR
jgi:nicotinamidase-related amidase